MTLLKILFVLKSAKTLANELKLFLQLRSTEFGDSEFKEMKCLIEELESSLVKDFDERDSSEMFIEIDKLFYTVGKINCLFEKLNIHHSSN